MRPRRHGCVLDQFLVQVFILVTMTRQAYIKVVAVTMQRRRKLLMLVVSLARIQRTHIYCVSAAVSLVEP